jgi:tRNA-2-methylthio-N6-dimethylallyladenosine synthase
VSPQPLPLLGPSPSGKRVFIESFGCQMNDYDVARMVEVMRKSGYERTDAPEQADLIIINTCSIREKAENKAVSAAGRYRPLKEKNPNLLLAIGGCVAQQEGQALLKRVPLADLTFGPDQIPSLPAHVETLRDGGRGGTRRDVPARYKLRLAKTEVIDVEDYEFLDADPRPGDVKVTALVTIQKGCDNYCAYCIVPTTRGREVSRPADEIVAEVGRFVQAGAREVTLIGQNVNAYHAIGAPDGDDFAELLRRVDAVPGLLRLRFTTSHPHYFSHKVAEAFRDLPRLSPWLHLPVQAGSTRVLGLMARDYTREQYLEKIAYIKAVCPDISLSTDVIVGYPGETERDFEDTISLLSLVRYDSIYSFAYSARPGTPAQDLPDDLPPEEKSRRLQAVQALQREITTERLGRMVGRTEPILIEGMARMGNGQLCGRTGGNHMVNIDPAGKTGGESSASLGRPETGGHAVGPVWIGRVLPVEITAAKANTLAGRLL